MLRLRAYLILLVLALVFFIDLVLHPTQVLYSDHSDILALHLPDKIFLCHAFHQTGELPLWCPYRFAGVPFIHDFQVGAYYPPHWLLLALPEEYIGAGLSWLVVFHVAIAGWTMYAYARFRGLGELGSLVAAIGYMFSGKLMLHVLAGGHFNMLLIAWLPLAAMLFEMALARAFNGKWFAALGLATWAGAVFSLIVLTAYPYVTLYAGLFLAMWTLGALMGRGAQSSSTQLAPTPLAEVECGFVTRTAKSDPVAPYRACLGGGRVLLGGLVRWAILGVWAGMIAAGLAAVQLLPAMEAAKWATRTAAVTNPFNDSLWPLVFLAGPSLIREPATLMWEVRGGFGVVWLGVAALAPLLQRGRTRYETAVCIVLMLLALGGIVVLYWIPGVAMFRLPSRIFLVMTFPVAFLAGKSTDLLWSSQPAAADLKSAHGLFFKVVGCVLFLVSAGYMLALAWDNLRLQPYWAALALTVPAMAWLLKRLYADRIVDDKTAVPRSFGNRSRLFKLAWFVCLLADLWALAWPEVRVARMEAIYPASPSVSYLASQAQGWRVLDLDQHFESTHERQVAALGILSPPRRPIIAACSPFGYGAPLANMFRIEALRGFNPIDVRRYKEYLQLMTDRDEPIRPLDENCPFGFPSIGNFRPVNWRLADVLGVRYLLVGQGEYRSDGDPRWQKVLWDSDPMAYTIAEGGVVPLDGFTVYRSDSTLPRAFVVGEAELLPEGSEVLEKLRTTDFRKTVLLESNEAPSNDGDYREASVIESQPNRVRIHVPDGPAGYLVLADVWYPGWHATVDGREVPCLRGDYLFRTVALSKGAHEVEFTFWPESYARGRWISGAALLILIMSMLMALFLTGWHALSLRRACSTVRDCMPRPSQTQGVPPIMAAPASSANV